MNTVSDLTERELIARLQALLPSPPSWLAVGIGDDAAVIEPERNRLEVITVDAIVEGIHFDRRFTPPEAIGHRALAVNLSDLAAMGAEPRYALLSFALPPALSCDDYDGIASGIARLAARYKLHVIGGNLTRSPGPLMIDITVAGGVKRRQVLTRGGARPGDELYVSGSIGSAAAGLRWLQASVGPSVGPSFSSGDPTDVPHARPEGRAYTVADCIDRYLYPDPRIKLGLLLGRNRAATACMDLSDGLADAAHQIAAASHVGIVVDAASIPIDPAAGVQLSAGGADPILAALSGGDDYELLFSVHPRRRRRLEGALRHAGLPVTKIGVCTEGSAVVLRRASEQGVQDEPMPKGYGHFG